LVMTVTAVLGLGLALRALRPGASSLECAPHREVRLPIRLPRPLSRVPGIAWGCALVAFLNAACWSEVSPPLQTPDEPAHFAYVQELAEAHRLPTHGTTYSPEEEVALADLHHNAVQFVPGAATISSRAQQRKLQHDLRAGYARVGPADAGTAASEPPTYYALEAIPYELGSGGTLLARLQLMRLLSALFGGLTALFAYLFVREALPGAPWAWAVGGLGVAFAPALGYMSGAVNPDAMLFAVSAALFYLLARAYRRGLTVRLATAIGATMALGSLTKLNFYGLIPGALAALVVLAIRRRPTSRRAAHVALAVTCAVAVCPTLAYTALASPVSHPPLSELSSAAATATHQGSTLEEISYSWQLFLPRLPGMTNYFPGISTWRQLWFDGLVGLYGWADTQFPVWVYELALIAAALIGLLCARELIRTRTTLVRRAGELATYALMAAGVMALVGAASYGAGAPHGPPFWEPRYLLPMLPLFGALLALAARGAGRRWGPAAGMLLVVLVLSHDIFSQLLVVSRYYH
ncbi:MAG TPA: DUF2142 domain-containing protein, partial [Solirubrobacteraceae bacterium]|nr:DUF2142 domain-containing protein [Solirubrobacteraceae bacterium]